MESRESEGQNILTDHQYDGIKEYDNPLPNWWLVTFFGTIIFGFLYLIHFSVGGGLTQVDEFELEMLSLPRIQEKIWKESDFEAHLNDLQFQMSGAVIFDGKCASCHAVDGGGLIGPNLTDDFWKFGKGTASDIANIVSEGVVEKGMPAWGSILNEQELKQVSLFVRSLGGKVPKNPKSPEGLKVGL